MGSLSRYSGGAWVSAAIMRKAGTVGVTSTVTALGGVSPPPPPPPVSYHRATGFAGGASTLNASDADLARMLSMAKTARMRFCRVDATWSSMQPTSGGTINYGNLDRVVNAIISAGMEPLLIPTYPPGWASDGSGGAHPGIGNTTAFGTFCKAVATHYLGKVTVYEICNEPNLSIFWTNPNVAAYTAALKSAYTAIKSVSSTLYVFSGGLSPNSGTNSPISFVNGFYANGGQGFFDGIGIHPYCYPTLPNDSDVSWSCYKQMWSVHDIMTSKGDGAKLIWGTEFGAPTDVGTGHVSESVQAETVRQVLQAAVDNSWMGPMLVYTLRDPGTSTIDREDHFGIVRRDFTPKPAYTTFQGFGT